MRLGGTPRRPGGRTSHRFRARPHDGRDGPEPLHADALTTLVEAQQEITVIRNLLARFGDCPGPGTAVGPDYHLTVYGAYGFLLFSSADVREALVNGLRYSCLTFSFSTMTAHHDDGCLTLVYDGETLGLGLPMSSPWTAKVMEQECIAQRTLRLSSHGAAASVRAHLASLPRISAGLDEVARALHSSPRTLRRHLKEQGTSFRDIVDEVRYDRAKRLLHGGGISRADLADRLGFHDAFGLTRATKRWGAG